MRGVVAAGHSETARAATTILEMGGNAFDAIIAAHLAACVAEPVLTSLGGGGFLLAWHQGDAKVYDFFVHTPLERRPLHELDFHPIHADFGAAIQAFHIGMGSIATPGFIKGLFAVHQDLCTLPMEILMAPAIRLARQGVVVNALQAHAFQVVAPIYTRSPKALSLFGSRRHPGRLLEEGERLYLPELAHTLERLAREGEGWFYQGELGERLVEDCQAQGGYLTLEDLRRYRVEKRKPLEFTYRDALLLTNPPPACGGTLIAFGLKLLETFSLERFGFGSLEHLAFLAHAMDLTQEARGAFRQDVFKAFPLFRERLGKRLGATTHVSVIDAWGNLASMTVTNGEGSGYVLPGTGIMLNNMLGEEDLNPEGFHRWRPDARLPSMMAPTLVFREGEAIALGSGGSNRIRTAILQVLVNLLDFGLSLEEAVQRPRIHVEDGLLSLEPGFPQEVVDALARDFPRMKRWSRKSLFFGGVHCALWHRGAMRFQGAGDARRGGVAFVLK